MRVLVQDMNYNNYQWTGYPPDPDSQDQSRVKLAYGDAIDEHDYCNYSNYI